MTSASKFQTWAAQHGYLGLLSGVHPDDFVAGLRKAYNAGRKSVQLPVSPTPAQRTRFNHLLDKHRHMLPLDGAVLKGYDILALLNVALGVDHAYGRDKGATPLDRDTQDQIASVLLQSGTPEQQRQAVAYAVGDEPSDPEVPITRSLLRAAIGELRQHALPAGADDQVVLNLEAAVLRSEIDCTHPEGCTRCNCNWCGFDAALLIRTGPLVDEWRVGLFRSSGSPGTQVRLIATGAAQIAEYGAHKDFISWVYSEQTYSQPPKETST